MENDFEVDTEAVICYILETIKRDNMQQGDDEWTS